MKTYIEMKNSAGELNYAYNFWNKMRDSYANELILDVARNANSGGYMFPCAANDKYESSLKKYSVFSNIATVHSKFGGPTNVFAYDSDPGAVFMPEYGDVVVEDLAGDFTKHTIYNNKLAIILRASVEFIHDASFDIESYIVNRLAKAFSKSEDKAFVTGTGDHEPLGILNETAGAETGVTASAVTFDSLVDLFFSIDKDYRKAGVWLMNDNTALSLRKLKDENGNYIWNHTNDTILGKPVHICNDMPDAVAGEKPIAFGDFSYYWIVRRSPVFIRTLVEKFALNNQIGYMGYEFVDGKLIRRDAVKVLKIETEE